MTWATKRKIQYLSGFFGVILVILFIFLYPVIFKKPTCTDGKKNGTETGVDCGGACSRMCKEVTSDPVILWSRAFPVILNTYNFVALVENQNKNSAIEKIDYEFRAYDVNNRLLGRRKGTTYIPPSKQFAIFEARFDSGEAKVKSITFEFVPPFNWTKKEPTVNNLDLYVDNVLMGEDDKNPSLSARIKNESIQDIPSFEVFVILYDQEGNAINVSKTVKEGLSSGESLPVFFTWPEELTGDPVVKDILIEINPFKVSF
ncbi:MAG: hypothetical protein UR85_C0001G0004 [Candidatus Nomurabacteria bacterium GW2011_GWF2_35_66]|uniref:Glucose/sorbosone dehydrogenase n=1 Tax=Candidatus Nomurabacteria bacterium GW2011_GWE1_35_16 TaxID=1618761 RepID=A0A0G0BBK9_9BACT|nr:MAG: hypothetical protein UR55_C0003G0009 [Candidatus Nomurabacteria bacterium GW2011_GWF1_34_20]KKP63517.1 MAG: hypothetical protein UR57_C0003G0004 [Candidatus Nomurabacteria bacterium GW2011_GWE2_34_25]KKP66709.1 MAG: hypothetical protein UR64_C0003G0002 [Candidatus Nomurabacteria bacterium GW2011_GWE1_35_16]KKP83809.1 MAG: hypothetical protein UR85_C0001G0004 [Candidatus Nomurabacteria bacterium GW2011_GWF2_35_66]HAE36401.1 hypothetical protein [Candidatus Nomurabacteria bacterium]